MPQLLVTPSQAHLASYAAALQSGWSPDNVGGVKTSQAQLRWIAEDAEAFLASLDDPEGRGAPITLPDGSVVKRLPGVVRWMWESGFVGSIGFRWQTGTAALPPYVLGHIGFAVIPARRNHGYAKRALREILELARRNRFPHVELTCTPDNFASQRVILGCGGQLVERFEKLPAYGGGEALRFRIPL